MLLLNKNFRMFISNWEFISLNVTGLVLALEFLIQARLNYIGFLKYIVHSWFKMHPTKHSCGWWKINFQAWIHFIIYADHSHPFQIAIFYTYLLPFFNQMAALICAMAMGDAHLVRTAGSVSARPAGEGLDAMLPWKLRVLITRIMREVSKSLPFKIPKE